MLTRKTMLVGCGGLVAATALPACGGGSTSPLPAVAAVPVTPAITGASQSFTYNGQSGTIQGTQSLYHGTFADGSTFNGQLSGVVMMFSATNSSGVVTSGTITKNADGSATYHDSGRVIPLRADDISVDVTKRQADATKRQVKILYWDFWGSAFDVAGVALAILLLPEAAFVCAIIGAAIGVYSVFGGDF
jgi:hypothetical protein